MEADIVLGYSSLQPDREMPERLRQVLTQECVSNEYPADYRQDLAKAPRDRIEDNNQENDADDNIRPIGDSHPQLESVIVDPYVPCGHER